MCILFCDLLSPLGVSDTLELTLLSLGRLWTSFWDPLGRLGLPRGSPWRHFGFPLAPLGFRGAIWGTLGSQVELGMTFGEMDVLFRQYDLCIKNVLAEFSAGSPGSPGSRVSTQSGARAAAPNPTSLAPGARMTVVNTLPQTNKQWAKYGTI